MMTVNWLESADRLWTMLCCGIKDPAVRVTVAIKTVLANSCALKYAMIVV